MREVTEEQREAESKKSRVEVKASTNIPSEGMINK